MPPRAPVPLTESAEEPQRRGNSNHPYRRRHLETFALLAVPAAYTSRIGPLPDVANLSPRQPAVLAKTAASLNLRSDGRFDLGLGTGAFWDAIWALGGPRRAPGETVEPLDEAIEVIRRMWSGERDLRCDGRHYGLRDGHSGPVPPHPIGI